MIIKHIGKHNSKKVIILYRTVPNEDHMALVAYSDLLPRNMHDEIMKVLESPVGQQSENLADALFRNTGSDGRNSLEALHRDGFIKKVQTSQVLVTPTTTSSVRLDELNKILTEMATGEAAVKRLQELDKSKGFSDIGRNKPVEPAAEAEAKVVVDPQLQPNALAEEASLVQVAFKNDEEHRRYLRKQALSLRQDAKDMISKAQKLEEQARQLKKPNDQKDTALAS
jgi:hypothetical protein